MKDKVFIGSSREALPVAREVQKHFKERYEERYEVRLWNENVYRPGGELLGFPLENS